MAWLTKCQAAWAKRKKKIVKVDELTRYFVMSL